jgi:pimeloyl-ACP methyl ester carboxylesterase
LSLYLWVPLILLALGLLNWLLWPRIGAVIWHRWLLLRLKTTPIAEELTTSELVPESKFLEIEGLRLHYVQAGKGPDLVLLHGIGASLYIWRFLFPLLQTQFRVTALDIPGFGKSGKDHTRDYGLDAQTQIMAAAIDDLKLIEPLLVGSSMGGAISLWLGRNFAKRFKKIVVIAPAVDHALVPRTVGLLASGSPIFRRALNRTTMKILLRQVMARRELVTDATVDAYLEPFLDQGESVRAFLRATSLLSDRRLPNALNEVSAQVLVLYGEKDLMVPRTSILRLMKILPSARLESHMYAGHHLMEDEPRWLAEKLLDFAKNGLPKSQTR